MAIELFDYQREMRSSVLEAFVSLNFNFVMCQMSTGTGKTHVLASVVIFYILSLSEPPKAQRCNCSISLVRDNYLVAGFDRVGEY